MLRPPTILGRIDVDITVGSQQCQHVVGDVPVRTQLAHPASLDRSKLSQPSQASLVFLMRATTEVVDQVGIVVLFEVVTLSVVSHDSDTISCPASDELFASSRNFVGSAAA